MEGIDARLWRAIGNKRCNGLRVTEGKHGAECITLTFEGGVHVELEMILDWHYSELQASYIDVEIDQPGSGGFGVLAEGEE